MHSFLQEPDNCFSLAKEKIVTIDIVFETEDVA